MPPLAGLDVGWLDEEGKFNSDDEDEEEDDVVARELVHGAAKLLLLLFDNVNFRKILAVSWLLIFDALLLLPEDSFIKFSIVFDWLFEMLDDWDEDV